MSLRSLVLGGGVRAWRRATKVWSLEPEQDPRGTQVSLFFFSSSSSSCLQWRKNKKKVTAAWLPSPSSFSFFLAALQRSEEGDGSQRSCLFFLFLLRCNVAKKATTATLSLPSSYFFLAAALQRSKVTFFSFFLRCLFFSCCTTLQHCNVAKKAMTATLPSPSSFIFLATALQRNEVTFFFPCCYTIAQ